MRIILHTLGLIILDGAAASIDSFSIATTGMFVCVCCDVAAALVFFAGLFYLKPKKKD